MKLTARVRTMERKTRPPATPLMPERMDRRVPFTPEQLLAAFERLCPSFVQHPARMVENYREWDVVRAVPEVVPDAAESV